MTEFEKADINGDGTIDKAEWQKLEFEDRRRRLDDEDAQRDQQRKMVWYVLFGMLGYPFFVVAASLLKIGDAAEILGSMASIYFPATSLILGAFFGANAYMSKKESREEDY